LTGLTPAEISDIAKRDISGAGLGSQMISKVMDEGYRRDVLDERSRRFDVSSEEGKRRFDITSEQAGEKIGISRDALDSIDNFRSGQLDLGLLKQDLNDREFAALENYRGSDVHLKEARAMLINEQSARVAAETDILVDKLENPDFNRSGYWQMIDEDNKAIQVKVGEDIPKGARWPTAGTKGRLAEKDLEQFKRQAANMERNLPYQLGEDSEFLDNPVSAGSMDYINEYGDNAYGYFQIPTDKGGVKGFQVPFPKIPGVGQLRYSDVKALAERQGLTPEEFVRKVGWLKTE